MSKIKVENSILSVLLESVRVYGANIWPFTRYMLFPVFGQLIGLALIFGLASVYTAKLPELISTYAFFNSFSSIVLCVILITVPGMLLFLKAFWDFLVAYGALNSMAESAINTGKVYDFPAHNAVVTNRTFKFLALWFVISILAVIASFPLIWLIGGIFFIYFILVFQVFIFEPNSSIYDCFKRSMLLIKGNFARTFIILAVVAFFTHYLFVEGFSVFFDLTKLSGLLGGIFENWVQGNISLDNFNNYMININPRFDVITPSKIAGMFVYQIVFFIVTGLTLPLRCVCWSMWYKVLSRDYSSSAVSKKPTNARGRKQLDKNIIRRATQKEED